MHKRLSGIHNRKSEIIYGFQYHTILFLYIKLQQSYVYFSLGLQWSTTLLFILKYSRHFVFIDREEKGIKGDFRFSSCIYTSHSISSNSSPLHSHHDNKSGSEKEKVSSPVVKKILCQLLNVNLKTLFFFMDCRNVE